MPHPVAVMCMSGGVDSSVAAALLLKQGFEVIGATMRLWKGPPEHGMRPRHACVGPGELEDIEDAAAVARRLGIPHHIIDLGDEYDSTVLDYVRSQYRNGRTPNPCILCNARIKLGALPQKLRGLGIAFDYIATGHYARIVRAENGRYQLLKAVDVRKDQTYFLSGLPRDLLASLLFPLGGLSKTDVRRTARELGLNVAEKEESQDFMEGGYSLLFTDKSAAGPILDEQGRVLGEHKGIVHYTIGQRRGLGVSAKKPLYVVRIDPASNAVVVGPRERLYSSALHAASVNWLCDRPRDPFRTAVKIRSTSADAPALASPLPDGRVKVDFDAPQLSITPGQAAVFYDGPVCIGGGIIEAPCASWRVG